MIQFHHQNNNIKFNRIAVVIRGQYRLWDYTKDRIFYVYARLSKNIDWYITTWDNTPLHQIENWKRDFYGRNLVDIIQCSNHEIYSDSWLAPAYLQHMAAISIQNSQIGYDIVFDQRTDAVTFRTPVEERTYNIQTRTIYTAIPPQVIDYKDSYGFQFSGMILDDRGFMCDQDTYKLLSERYLIPRDSLVICEGQFYNYCKNNQITMLGGSWLNHIVVRPEIYTQYQKIPNAKDIDDKFKDCCNNSIDRWLIMDHDQKNKIKQRYNINPKEYLNTVDKIY